MVPIDDVGLYVAVASLAMVLVAFAQHENVSIVMNWHYAFEVIVDQKRLDLVTIVVVIFDVNLHRFVFPLLIDSSQLMWLMIVCYRVYNVEWVERIVIGMIVTNELMLLTIHTYYAVGVDCQSVSAVDVDWNVIRALNSLICMTLKMQSLFHCGHQDLTYYQMMSYLD